MTTPTVLFDRVTWERPPCQFRSFDHGMMIMMGLSSDEALRVGFALRAYDICWLESRFAAAYFIHSCLPGPQLTTDDSPSTQISAQRATCSCEAVPAMFLTRLFLCSTRPTTKKLTTPTRLLARLRAPPRT